MHPSGATNGMRVIVWDIRLPYALMALLVGMALGLAGAEMQTILNNSLASPFTLGVSSAAAFGAALAIVLGIGIPGVPESGFIPANAFLFALLSALLLDSLTRWTRVPTSGVVLFGIALVFTFNALVSIMQFVADEDTLQGLVFWTMGSLARASWEKLAVLAAAMAIVLPWSLRRAWQLTALRLGEERAMSLALMFAVCAWVPCCASACWRPFRLRLWGQLALLAWLHRIFLACCWEKIIAFICPEASLSVGWCYRWPR